MSVSNHLLFSEIFFQQIRRETADLDNLRVTLSTIRDTWRYYLSPPEGYAGPTWTPEAPLDLADVLHLRSYVVEQIFGYLELTYGPCAADERAFFLYGDWEKSTATGLCLVLPYTENIEGRQENGIIPKGRNYAQQLWRLLREHNLDWGVLTNGRHWRLFHRAELSPTETYLHVDLEQIIATNDIENYIVFHRFFSRPAFVRADDHRQRLDFYKEQSDRAAKMIEGHLSANVEEIMRKLCQGLVESCRDAGETLSTSATRKDIYKNALYLVYRLLFVLYAEARDLLPLDAPAYREVCLRDIVREVQRNHREGLNDADEYALWRRLQDLFALIDQGKPGAGVPAYNGGLFDPGRRPFLTRHRIRNAYLQEALIRLCTLPGKGLSYDQDRDPTPIDYRDLSVRHLGSLYEGLLEYNLFVVEGEVRVVRGSGKTTTYVPFSQAGKVRAGETVLAVGDVYFSETEGERKATGSYYTPEDVVDYIVRQTVGAKLDELKADFYANHEIERQLADLADTPPDLPAYGQIQRALDEQFLRFVREEVLALKILDPAMGSGHFLVNALHVVANFIVELLSATPWVNLDIDADVAYWKRQAAERCIFGVDLNDLAVELAKLCVWMTTTAKGKPLTFLDHHLRSGNSIVGSSLKDVGVYPKLQKESPEAFTLPLDRFAVDIKQIAAQYKTLYSQNSDEVNEVREKARIYEEHIRPLLHPYIELLSLHTGIYFDNGLDRDMYAQLGNAIGVPTSWQFFIESRGAAILAKTKDWNFLHWQVEFPEVFLIPDLPEEKKGFDIIVGNPPYIEMGRIKSLTPYLKQVYTLATARADAYIYFFERSFNLLRAGGILGFISSSTFTRTRSGELLRNYLRDHTTLQVFVDFGDMPVFAGVTAYPAIVVAAKQQPNVDHAVRGIRADVIKTVNINKVLRAEGFQVKQKELENESWRFEDRRIYALRNKIAESGHSLEHYYGLPLYGIKTGRNDAFLVDQRTRDLLVAQNPNSRKILKPIVEGRDIKAWQIDWRGTWIIYAYHGVKMDEYPAVLDYLRTFKHSLNQRATAGKHAWYELQQPQQAYVPAFESPKIVWPNLQDGPRYSFDAKQYYINAPACCLPTDDWLVLAILNSSVGWFWMQSVAVVRQNNWLEAKPQYVSTVPIPPVADADRVAICNLAQQLSEEACPNRIELEAELNNRIAWLYGLTSKEEQHILAGLPLLPQKQS